MNQEWKANILPNSTTRNSSLIKIHGLKTRNTIPDHPSSLTTLPKHRHPLDSSLTSSQRVPSPWLWQGSSSRWHSGPDPEPHAAAAAAGASSTQRINSSLAASHRSPPQMQPGSLSHRNGSADPKSRRCVPAPPSTDKPKQPTPNDCKSFSNLDYYSVSLLHCSTQIDGMCSISLPLSHVRVFSGRRRQGQVVAAWEGGSDSNLDTNSTMAVAAGWSEVSSSTGLGTCVAADKTDKGFDDFHVFLSKQLL
jgi:hypothetical protein